MQRLSSKEVGPLSDRETGSACETGVLGQHRRVRDTSECGRGRVWRRRKYDRNYLPSSGGTWASCFARIPTTRPHRSRTHIFGMLRRAAPKGARLAMAAKPILRATTCPPDASSQRIQLTGRGQRTKGCARRLSPSGEFPDSPQSSCAALSCCCLSVCPFRCYQRLAASVSERENKSGRKSLGGRKRRAAVGVRERVPLSARPLFWESGREPEFRHVDDAPLVFSPASDSGP